jgi:hypothetical protein
LKEKIHFLLDTLTQENAFIFLQAFLWVFGHALTWPRTRTLSELKLDESLKQFDGKIVFYFILLIFFQIKIILFPGKKLDIIGKLILNGLKMLDKVPEATLIQLQFLYP